MMGADMCHQASKVGTLQKNLKQNYITYFAIYRAAMMWHGNVEQMVSKYVDSFAFTQPH